jgi:hypothetical protein
LFHRNVMQVREWGSAELERYLRSRGLPVRECGQTWSNAYSKMTRAGRRGTTLCLVSRSRTRLPREDEVSDLFPYERRKENTIVAGDGAMFGR